MPVITTYASMSSRGFTSSGSAVLSNIYARYLPTTGNVDTQLLLSTTNATAENQNYFSYSDDGKLYVITWTQNSTNNNPLVLTKYLSNNYFGAAKTILLSARITSASVICNGNNIYVIVASTTGVLSVIKFDSNLNIVWNTIYSESGLSSQSSISVTIDSTSTYLYICTSGSTRRFYIFQNNGTLINAYDATAWFDNPNTLFFDSYGTSRIMAGNGATYFDLTGLTSVTGVTTRKINYTTTKQIVDPVTYYINGVTRYSYSGFYYNNLSVWYSGIVKRDFSGGAALSYRYVFAGITTPIFLGLTTTDTNVYAYVADDLFPYNLYVFKFDTNLSYINGYKLSNPGASGTPYNTYAPTYTPKYFNNSITSVSPISVWRLPNDLSLLANGTYVVDGITWTKSTYSGGVTRFSYSLTTTTTSPSITTVTPTLVSFTPTVTDTTDPFTYVGL